MSRNDFLKKHFHGPGGGAELLVIALPMIVSRSCETAMMFADRLFLSKLGAAPMAASIAGGLTSFLFMTFFVGLLGFSTTLVAQNLGAGKSEKCPLVITQAMILAVLSYPLVLACIPVGHWFFALFRHAPEQLVEEKAYFTILMWGGLFVLLRTSVDSFFCGIGKTRVIMYSAMIGGCVNIVANYALIFGNFGFPALGIRGAAYGTILGSCVSMLVTLGVYFSPGTRKLYPVTHAWHFSRPLFSSLLRLGYPAGLEFFLNFLAFDALILAFGAYQLSAATALSITFSWDMVAFVPLIGINMSVTSLVGRYMGGNDPQVAERAAYSGFKLATFYSFVLLLLFVSVPKQLALIFLPGEINTQHPDILPLAEYMIRLMSVYLFADATAITFSGALRGAGDTFWTMCISVATHWLMTLSAMFAIFLLKLPPRSTWLLIVFMISLIGVSFYLRFNSGAWRKIKVV